MQANEHLKRLPSLLIDMRGGLPCYVLLGAWDGGLAGTPSRAPCQGRARCVRAAGSGPIDEMILLDREVDAVTPLCTQLTFEGLVDETLGIRNGSVTLEAASGAPPHASAMQP